MKKNLFNKLRQLVRPEKGQSLVEFALLAPILLVLFMGMFDFGWILHQQIQMDNATRTGARRGAVGDTNPEILDMMKDRMTFEVPVESMTIEVRDPYGSAIDDNTDRTPDNRIFISIQRDNVALITPLGNFIDGMTSINLHSEAEFLIE